MCIRDRKISCLKGGVKNIWKNLMTLVFIYDYGEPEYAVGGWTVGVDGNGDTGCRLLKNCKIFAIVYTLVHFRQCGVYGSANL